MVDQINYPIHGDVLALLRYFILSLTFFLQFFNFKIKVYKAACLFTFSSILLLSLHTSNNLSLIASDYSYYCKVALNPLNSLNEVISAWTQRNFLFWPVLNIYGNIFKDCITTFNVYMAPLYFLLFYTIVKFSKLIFNQKDNYINISMIPFVTLYLPVLLSFQNLLRSGSSFAFLAAILFFLKVNDLTKAIICIFAGFIIHNSLILFIPIIFIFNFTKRLNVYHFIGVLIFYFPLAIFTKEWFAKGLGAFGYDTYATPFIYLFTILIIFISQYLFTFYFKANKNLKIFSEYNKFSLLIITSIIPFIIIGLKPVVLARILLCYLFLILPIPIGILNTDFKYKKINMMILSFSILPSLWYL